MHPVFRQALEGTLPSDDVCVCGLKRVAHQHGCAPSVQTTNPSRWADLYPHVTAAVRDALEQQCGPAMEEFVHTLGYELVSSIASVCGKAAVKAYQQGAK